jgi:curved DNA-binding protein CbpA
MRGIDELDHYELLEISSKATSTDIDRAYRMAQQTYGEGSLALYSIFESSDAAAIRDRFDEAYRVLSDPELRAQYDENEKVTAARLEREAAEARPRSVGSVPEESSLATFDSFEEAVREYDVLDEDPGGEYDGVRLRKTRLFRGIEIDDISNVTKVSGAHLRNIEDENFLDLPADVYVRGFVTAYAQTIGLDPKIVVPSYMARVQLSRAKTPQSRFLGRS